MSVQAIEIPLTLDPGGFVSGANDAAGATDNLARSLSVATAAAGPLQAALKTVTPSRAMLAGFTGFVAVATQSQAQLSKLQANAKTTGVEVPRLAKGMRELAREIPIGNTAARELVMNIGRMGIAARDNERRVLALAKTAGQLSGATGEGPTQLAEGLVQLSRSMDTGLDPKRVQGFADSLTTVTAETGASATGVLQFSKAIAPMAHAAGLGQSAVMGISASFASLGEDGYGASTAVNKMLGDMNRAVREGSPTMAAYANMVGKTREEFTALFETDPAEALAQITEAVANAGPNGARMLEQIGVEGVRGQRALQLLATSGNLRENVSTAVSAYGNNRTEEAAEAAYGGVADSLTDLRTTAEQLAEALGTPLLGVVGNLTDAMNLAVQPLRMAAESKPVQKVVEAAAYAAIPLAMGRFLAGPAVTAALGLQAASSGPVRGLMAGAALGRAGGDAAAARQSWLARMPIIGGRSMIDAYAAGGPVGRGMFERVNRGAIENSRDLLYRPGGGIPGGNPGMLSMFRSYGLAGLTVAAQLTASQLRAPRIRAEDRTWQRILPNTGLYQRFGATMTGIGGQLGAGTMGMADAARASRTALADLAKEARGTRGALGQITTFGRTFAMMPLQLAGTAGVLGTRGARSALGALATPFGGAVGLGIAGLAAGGAGIAAYQNRQTRESDERLNASSFIDDYRVAMGKATDATQTFAGKMQTAADTMVGSVESMAEALRIDEADRRAAAQLQGEPVRRFAGTNEQIAEQIAFQAQSYGMSPDEMQRVALDLQRQMPDRTQQILDLVSAAGTAEAPLGGANLAGVGALLEGVSGTQDASRGGWRQYGIGVLNAVQKSLLSRNDEATNPLIRSTLTPATEQAARDTVVNINDRAGQRARLYDEGYVQQEQFREINEAVRYAQEEIGGERGKDIANEIMLTFQRQGGYGERRIGPADIEEAGSYTAALAQVDSTFRGVYEDFQQRQGRQETGQFEARIAENQVARLLQGNGLQSVFSSTGPQADSAVNRAVRYATQERPEDPQGQARALDALLANAAATGTPLANLAADAAEAANAIGNVADPAYQLAAALQEAATVRLQAQAPFMTGAEYAGQRASLAQRRMNIAPNTAEGREDREEAAQELMGLQAEVANAMKERLNRQREYQVSSERMEADHVRNLSHQEADFQRSRVRATDDYTRQRGRILANAARQEARAEFDYNRSRTRAEADFARARARQERDFRISEAHAFEDYYKSRDRMVRDFNKQMQRQVEDAAKTLYDPYQRIMVEPTWDARSLMGNMQEQADAMRTQLENLAELRQAGVSDATIELLGLNSPEHAQQLAQLLADIANDPAIAQQLNSMAENRKSLAGQLIGDPSNPEMRRAREDLNSQLADMAADFEQAMARNREAFARSAADSASDLALSMARMAEDFRTGMARTREDLAISMAQMAADQATAMARAEEDFRQAAARQGEAYRIARARAGEDMKRMDEEIVGSLTTLSDAFNRAVSGQFVDFQKITANGMQGWLTFARQFGAAFNAAMGGSVRVSYVPGSAGTGNVYGPAIPKAAEGAFINRRQLVEVGEQSPEAIIPLDHRGVRFLAGVLQRMSPVIRPETRTDEGVRRLSPVRAGEADRVATAGRQTLVRYSSDTYNYDHSTKVLGEVKVISNDPDEMARKLAAKHSRENLTKRVSRG